MLDKRRREFVSLLGGAAVAWSLPARAQQGDRMRRVGVLLPSAADDADFQARVGALLQGLALSGWTIGRNVRMDLRWGRGDINRMQALAQELVSLRPDIILTSTTMPTLAVRRETRRIPLVFVNVTDPVATGMVERLDRPSENITGFVDFEATMGGKWLELLSEIAPGLKRAAFMFNPDTAAYASAYMPSLEAAARSLKIELTIAPVHSDVEIEATIIALGREPRSGLVVMPEIFTAARRAPIISAAARNNVRAVYGFSYFARDGGLLSYGPDPVDIFRRSAAYVDRILRGANPEDLPVQLPIKFVMALNAKTAKALGLAVPQSMLLRADEVIE